MKKSRKLSRKSTSRKVSRKSISHKLSRKVSRKLSRNVHKRSNRRFNEGEEEIKKLDDDNVIVSKKNVDKLKNLVKGISNAINDFNKKKLETDSIASMD
jgi:hypothetical protein